MKTIIFEGKTNPCNVYGFEFIGTTVGKVTSNFKDTNFCELLPLTSGECGSSCQWNFNHKTNELKIQGSGIFQIDYKESLDLLALKGRVKSLSIVGIETITENAFTNFTGITSIIIPESITSIGNNSFANTTSLENIVYKGSTNPCKENVKAFQSSKAKLVVITSKYTGDSFCGLSIFSPNGTCGDNCTWNYDGETRLMTIEGTGKMTNYTASATKRPTWFVDNTPIQTIIINGIESIGDYAFNDLVYLQSITIGKSVETIGINPFIDCNKLTKVTFESNEHFIFKQGMILTKNKTEIITYLCSNTDSGCIFLPDELVKIRKFAFYANNYLEMVVIPMNVYTIEDYAFAYCKNLYHVYYLGVPTTLPPTVSGSAFNSCSALSNIKVKKEYPSSEFGNESTNQQQKLTTGTISYFFNKNSGLLVFYGTGEMEEDYEDNSVEGNTKAPWKTSRERIKYVVFENGIKTIGGHVFYYHNETSGLYGYPNIVDIKFGNTVSRIEEYAFYNCSSLSKMIFPESLTFISNYAFMSTSSLKELTFKSILTLEFSIFWGSSSLKTIYYYGDKEPNYYKNKDCGNLKLCCCSSLPCAPFYCQTDQLKTVYVTNNYNGPNSTFCGKEVTIIKSL